MKKYLKPGVFVTQIDLERMVAGSDPNVKYSGEKVSSSYEALGKGRGNYDSEEETSHGLW